MHIGGIMVFDPLPDGGAPSREELCRHLASRLGQLPRYGQRLSEPHTGGLSWPEWEDDPAFDISRHVARAALPAPGGYEELAEWASGFFSQRLDRHRPLWEMALVEGLADGRWALAHKTHHCHGRWRRLGRRRPPAARHDGGRLADPRRRPRPPRAVRAAGRGPSPSDADRPASAPHPSASGPLASLAHAWAGLLPIDTIVHAAQMGAHGALHPREALRSARSAIDLIVREELHAAPHTSLNVPIGTQAPFRCRARPAGGPEGDQELPRRHGQRRRARLSPRAACRALLQSRGEALPAAGLRAMVPMNVRVASEHLALGNRVSSLYVELPVAAGRSSAALPRNRGPL